MANRSMRSLSLFAIIFFSLSSMGIKKMELTSSAFKHQTNIPATYTCDGKNISPPLLWKNAPQNATSFALIMDDPDAPRGTWVHWVVWNIAKTATSLSENQKKDPALPDGTRQGTGDSHGVGYAGPCPPSGTHRYFFKLYALDKELTLSAGTTKAQLEAAMKGHIVAQTELIGLYQRASQTK